MIFVLRVWGAYFWRGLYMEGHIFGILRYAVSSVSIAGVKLREKHEFIINTLPRFVICSRRSRSLWMFLIMLTSQDCQWSLLHTPPCSDHVLGKLPSNFLALSPHVWVIKIRTLLVTRTSGSMTGHWKPHSPKENQTTRTMPKGGRSRRQIERIVERRKLLTLTSIKYEQSGRGKNSKDFSIQNTDGLAFSLICKIKIF